MTSSTSLTSMSTGMGIITDMFQYEFMTNAFRFNQIFGLAVIIQNTGNKKLKGENNDWS